MCVKTSSLISYLLPFIKQTATKHSVKDKVGAQQGKENIKQNRIQKTASQTTENYVHWPSVVLSSLHTFGSINIRCADSETSSTEFGYPMAIFVSPFLLCSLSFSHSLSLSLATMTRAKNLKKHTFSAPPMAVVAYFGFPAARKSSGIIYERFSKLSIDSSTIRCLCVCVATCGWFGGVEESGCIFISRYHYGFPITFIRFYSPHS